MIHFSKRSFALTGYSKIVATRFSDLDEGIIEVTRIANFKNWPIAEKNKMLLNLPMKLWKHVVCTLRILSAWSMIQRSKCGFRLQITREFNELMQMTRELKRLMWIIREHKGLMPMIYAYGLTLPVCLNITT